jgi:hypothetical protein
MFNIKKEIIWGLVGSLVVIGLAIYYGVVYSASMASLGSSAAIKQGVAGGTITLTAEEVKKHNTASDCWTIDANNVYDMTSYMNLHPGGAGRISVYCGSDMTQAFLTKGGRGSHSATADAQLKMLLLGPLGGTSSGQVSQDNITKLQNMGGYGGDN